MLPIMYCLSADTLVDVYVWADLKFAVKTLSYLKEINTF